MKLLKGIFWPFNLKDIIIIISCANLCFIKVWSEFLYNTSAQNYFMQGLPTYVSFTGLIINILIISMLLFLIKSTSIIDKRLKILYELFLVLAIFYPINYIRQYFNVGFQEHSSLLIASLLVMLFLLFGIIKNRNVLWPSLVRVISVFYLITAPFIVVTFSQGFNFIYRNIGIDNVAIKNASMLDTSPNRRVIWIIFDEFDHRLGFEDRPSKIQMPELDRFSGESFFASHAYPPGRQTEISVPALLTGKMVVNSRPVENDVLLTYPDGENSYWSTQPSVFLSAQKLGVNSAIVGWAFPYNRVLGNQVAYVFNRTSSFNYKVDESLVEQMITQLTVLWPFSFTSITENNYNLLLDETKRVVSDRRFGLVFVHLPVPHGPFVYNNETSQFVMLKYSPQIGYPKNLVLADKTFGEIREAMEKSDQWEDNTIIVSSDHWWRDAKSYDGKIDHRVPFMIKFARQNDSVKCDEPFNTIITQRLVIDIIEGKISHSDQFMKWLNQHSTIGESEYTKNLK